MSQILIIIAAVCFGLEALRVNIPLNLTAAGFCLLTVALLLL